MIRNLVSDTRAWRGRLAAAFTLTLLLSACSTEPPMPIPGLREYFHTEIAANGAKRFTYSLEMEHRDVPAPYTASGPNRGRLSRQSMMAGGGHMMGQGGAQPVQFDRALKQKLTETGFCRDGYFELERTVSPLGGEVRGECRDGAQR